MQGYFGRASAHSRIKATILDLVTVEDWVEEIFAEGVGVKWKNGQGGGGGEGKPPSGLLWLSDGAFQLLIGRS